VRWPSLAGPLYVVVGGALGVAAMVGVLVWAGVPAPPAVDLAIARARALEATLVSGEAALRGEAAWANLWTYEPGR